MLSPDQVISVASHSRHLHPAYTTYKGIHIITYDA
jgi:hypothetical protein